MAALSGRGRHAFVDWVELSPRSLTALFVHTGGGRALVGTLGSDCVLARQFHPHTGRAENYLLYNNGKETGHKNTDYHYYAENLVKLLHGTVAGAVFAQGLVGGGMVNPAIVVAFWNVANNSPKGTWDSFDAESCHVQICMGQLLLSVLSKM
ncbi:hypothetical protein ACA910_022730 [Epithemia clementina (nom. ined.)]